MKSCQEELQGEMWDPTEGQPPFQQGGDRFRKGQDPQWGFRSRCGEIDEDAMRPKRGQWHGKLREGGAAGCLRVPHGDVRWGTGMRGGSRYVRRAESLCQRPHKATEGSGAPRQRRVTAPTRRNPCQVMWFVSSPWSEWVICRLGGGGEARRCGGGR